MRDTQGTEMIENGSRTRRQAATDRQTKTETSGKNLLQSKEIPLTSGKKKNVEQKGNSRKRPPEKLSESPAKKVMLSSVISSTKMQDIVSPRRSSRASVPNRRYKDMEVLTSAKSNKSETSAKDRKSVKEKHKFATGIKLCETESESEDIMTEEIPIDTSQAMDALASSNNEISMDNTQTVDIVTDSGNEIKKDSIDDVKNPACEVKVEISESHTTVIMPAMTENSDADKHSKVRTIDTNQIRREDQQTGANISSSEPSTPIEYETDHPNVIVIDPTSDKNISKNMSKKKASPRPSLQEIPMSSLKKISSGQVVHVPIIKTNIVNTDSYIHIVKREIARGNRTVKHDESIDDKLETVTDVSIDADYILKKQIETNGDAVKDGHNETDICSDNKDGNKMNLTTEVEGKPGTRTGEISATMTKDIITGVKVLDKHNSLQKIDGSDTNLAQTISTALGHKVEIIKVPLETKPGTDEGKHVVSGTVTVPEEMNSNETAAGLMTLRETNDSETLIHLEGTENMPEIVSTDSVHTVVELAENQENGIASPVRENIEFVNIVTDIAEPYTVEVSDGAENGDKILVNCDTSFSKVDSISQNDNSKPALQTSFCEVIEYDGKRKAALPQPGPAVSPFDYVVLGDNLIEIRKPQPLHGRIQQPKHDDTEPNSGNVEYVVINESKGSKTNMSAVTQDSLSTLTKVGQSLSPVKVVTPVASLSQLQRASQSNTHGHIIRGDPTAPPTNVVEISEDVFQRELYSGGKPTADIAQQQEPTTEELTTIRDTDNLIVTTDQSNDNAIITVMTDSESGRSEPVLGQVSQTECISDDMVSRPEPLQLNKQARLPGGGAKVYAVGQGDLKDKGLKYEVRHVKAKASTAEDGKTATGITEDQNVQVTDISKLVSTTISQTECVSEDNDSRALPLPCIEKIKQSRMLGTGSKIVVVGKDHLKQKGLTYEIGPVRQKSRTAEEEKLETDVSEDQNVQLQDENKSLDEDQKSFLTENGDCIVIMNNKKEKLANSAGTQTPVTAKVESGGHVEKMLIHAELKTVTKSKEDGSSEKQETEQFIIVHLPEGTEIKQKDVKTPVNYQQYNETEITMLDDGQYVCVDCHYVTSKRSNWFKHRRKHLGIKPHECPFCSYKAGTSSNLKRHIAIHQDIRDFQCHICCMTFRQKIHLERHLKYRHEEKKIKCPLCEYTCANENPDLKIHIKRRHMPLPDGSVLPFTCEECGIMTVSKKDLRQHKKFHKKGPELKLFCEFCSFVTDCESRLKRHMYIHTKEKPFQCGLCSYRATQKEHVLRHMKSQHDIEVMKRKKTLLPKKEEKDGDEDTDSDESDTDNKNPFEQADYSSTDRIFACNHCTMRFAKLINLYKHLYSQHKSLMPDPNASDFQCVVCEFRTNNKKNLLVHMRKHNMQDQTPPSHVYSCVLCRYINPRRKNLFQHMKKKHGIEIMVKEDGTTNCMLTSDSSPVAFGGEENANLIPLSNIVTTHTLDENTLTIDSNGSATNTMKLITDVKTNSSGGNVSIENVINIEDIGSYVANSTAEDIQIVSDVSPMAAVGTSSQNGIKIMIAEHEAAEAIEGLQALAQQAGLLETQVIETVDESDGDLIAGNIVEKTDIITEQEMMSSVSQEVASQQEVMSLPPEGEQDPGIQLSTDTISQLSAGDYVEINGEVYEVEISSDTPVLVSRADEMGI